MFTDENLVGGSYIIDTQKKDIKSISYLITHLCKVIYHPSAGEQTYGIAAMSDGLVYRVGTKKAIIKGLNANKDWRFATKEEVLKVILYQTNKFGG